VNRTGRHVQKNPPGNPDIRRNIILFMLFRMFFNMRFYYPVFALFYRDAGIDLKQFGYLQALWSLAIITFEVPSGVLADLIGRKRILQVAGFLTVIEMVLFGLADRFWIFALNRLLSGFNESLVSGADAALLYDSLKRLKDEGRYKQIVGRTQYYALLFGSGATIAGAYLYTLDIRLPIWATAVCMVVPLSASLLFVEPSDYIPRWSWRAQWDTLATSVRYVARSSRLIYLIAFVMVVDACVRIVLVHNALYYQAIHIPVVWFGLVGVGVRLVMSVASRYVHTVDAALGFLGACRWTCALMLAAFGGLVLFLPYFGAIFVALLGAALVFTGLNVEAEINKIIPSEQRATILSLKGISLNIAFGLGMPLFDLVGRTDLQAAYFALFILFACAALLLTVTGRLFGRK